MWPQIYTMHVSLSLPQSGQGPFPESQRSQKKVNAQTFLSILHSSFELTAITRLKYYGPLAAEALGDQVIIGNLDKSIS